MFEKAKGYSIPYNIYAGEADGPENVKLDIEYGSKKIGHGVRIYQVPEVEKFVKD